MKFTYAVIIYGGLDGKTKLFDGYMVATTKVNALKQVIKKYPDEVEKCSEIQVYEDND